MTTIIAVSRQRIGPRGGGPLGYVVEESMSPRGIDDLRRIVRENFVSDNQPITDADITSSIRGILDALGRSEVRELKLKSGELLVLVESRVLAKYWNGNTETFRRCQLRA